MTDFERVFVDTAPFIYFLDDSGAFSDSAERFFIDINASRKEIVSSVITCEEYLVVPYRKNMLGKIRSFFDFTSMMGIELSPVTLEIAKKAAEIRGRYQHFKSMDCLQLASAVVNKCDLFVTNDKQLKQFDEIKCITLSEW